MTDKLKVKLKFSLQFVKESEYFLHMAKGHLLICGISQLAFPSALMQYTAKFT